MATRYKFNGVSFPIDPIKAIPIPTNVGRRGDGTVVLAPIWTLEMEFGFVDVANKAFFFDKFVAGGTYVITMEHPKDDSLIDVTGSTIDNVTTETMDVDDFAENFRVTVGNLRLPA